MCETVMLQVNPESAKGLETALWAATADDNGGGAGGGKGGASSDVDSVSAPPQPVHINYQGETSPAPKKKPRLVIPAVFFPAHCLSKTQTNKNPN